MKLALTVERADFRCDANFRHKEYEFAAPKGCVLKSIREDKIGDLSSDSNYAMKRKLGDTSSVTGISVNKKVMVCKTNMRPSMYVMDSARSLSEPAASLQESIWVRNLEDQSLMDVGVTESNRFRFLFFLDAQGKEEIESLRELILHASHTYAIFVSSNLDASKFGEHPSIAYSESSECKTLSREMGLLDPLGGGMYPVNYLVILDSHSNMRLKTPLRFHHAYAAYQKFALQIPQLKGLIEEYSQFASSQQI